MLTNDQIDQLVQQIVRRCQPQSVYIFGSYAKGNATARSDLDVLVVMQSTLPARLRKASLTPMLANRLVPIDLHVGTPEELVEYGSDPYSFLGTVVRSGRLVYGG
jgi:predicted nucleotidyltransferase